MGKSVVVDVKDAKIIPAPKYVYTVGVSCAEMRHKVVKHIATEIKPKIVLDLACGSGLYGLELRVKSKNVLMVGLDGCLTYLTSHYTLNCYNVRIHAMMKDYLSGLISVPADLILWMDGPEHFKKETAILTLNKLNRVIVSTPLFEYEQGPVEGNDLEIHRCWFSEKEINEVGYKTLFKVPYDGRGDIGAFTKGL